MGTQKRKPASKAKSPRAKNPAPPPTEEGENALDQALADSFPASDPPAETDPMRSIKENKPKRS